MPNSFFPALIAETSISLETFTAVLGWTTVINLCLLVMSTIMIFALRNPIKSFHAKLSGLTGEQLDQAYFQYLAQYKLLFLVFNLVPYLAIRLFVL